MKKFGVYNYINSSNKNNDANLEPMNLLLSLMANQNAGAMGNSPYNNYQTEENQTNSEFDNTEKAPPPPQKQYDLAKKDYINLYPHPKI